jgi:hypothetical protein
VFRNNADIADEALVRMARSSRDDGFAGAMPRALAANGPALVELRVGPAQLTPDLSI